MNDLLQLSNQFLIAMPALADANFQRSVTYICEHNVNGAVGFMINRPIGLTLEHVFSQMQITVSDERANQIPLLYGGPLQTERGFVIHSPVGKWRSSLIMSEEIAVTTSQDILDAIAQGQGPEQVIIVLGYAGWGASQLESEIMINSWLSCQSTKQILFDTPLELRWQAAAKEIGVDIRFMTDIIGHA